MYTNLFKNYPNLLGKTIRLRLPKEDDVFELLSMLQDEQIKKYFLDGKGNYERLEQVYDDFVAVSNENFGKKSVLCLIIEEIATGKIVGYREIFVDYFKDYVTIQGFTGYAHRNKGIAKESYQIIEIFLRQNGVNAIIANTDFGNFASIALLNSVGFKQESAFISESGNRLLLLKKLDLTETQHKLNESYDYCLKKLIVFCKMYLNGSNFNVKKSNSIKNNEKVNNGYEISFDSNLYVKYIQNPSGKQLPKMIHTFYTDGDVILCINPTLQKFVNIKPPYEHPFNFLLEHCSNVVL